MKYFKILNINKSEVLMDQLLRVLTHVNINRVINFIFDLWLEEKLNNIVNVYVLDCFFIDCFRVPKRVPRWRSSNKLFLKNIFIDIQRVQNKKCFTRSTSLSIQFIILTPTQQ